MRVFQKAQLAALIAIGAALPAVAQVQVTTYSGYSENYGVGLTFSDATGTANWGSINSNVAYPGWSWNAGNAFAADLTSTLSVAASGTYTFNLQSDDGSYVFIDGTLVGSEPGAHGIYAASFTDTLSAGNHAIEVQFYNGYCCGSGLELDLAEGLTLTSTTAVPEPSNTPMLVGGLGLLMFGVRRAMQRQGDH